jgi:hypothetical protein
VKYYVTELKARRARVEHLQEQAQGLLSESAAASSSRFTNRSDSDAIKEASRLNASRRLGKQLTLKNDKLIYSSRELDKNVGLVEKAKGQLDSFAKQYLDPDRKGESMEGDEDGETKTMETGWRAWFRNLR